MKHTSGLKGEEAFPDSVVKTRPRLYKTSPKHFIQNHQTYYRLMVARMKVISFFLARFQYTELEIETLIFFYIEFEMWRLGMNRTLSQCQSVRPQKSFCPLTASITMDVKNNYAYVTTQRILNKFLEINSSVGCMVWQ